MHGDSRSLKRVATATARALRGRAGAVSLVVLLVALLSIVAFGPGESLQLVYGPIQGVVITLAAAGLVVGLAGRPKRWWATWGLGIAVAAAAAVGLVWFFLHASGTVTQHYPPTFLLWVWAALFAAGVGATGWWSGAVVVRTVRVMTVPITVFASFLLINAHYGYWPTVGALLDSPVSGQVSARTFDQVIADPATEPIGANGMFGPVSLHSVPGYDAGGAWVWLPPAYDTAERSHLPVLVMLPGVPGFPYNWARAGGALATAESWSRHHGGVAPIMLLVSGNGAHDRDTECVNGPHGNSEAYLTRAVPQFIVHRLGVRVDPSRWGVAGFSEGGTCALGLATEEPHLYGRFVDIAGDIAPNFGPNQATTLKYLYGGNATAMADHEPLTLMARARYPRTEGWFAASSGDPTRVRVARTLTRASTAAGMTVTNDSGGPGGHSWSYAAKAFHLVYPSLVASMSPTRPFTGLRRPTPAGAEPVVVTGQRPAKGSGQPKKASASA